MPAGMGVGLAITVTFLPDPRLRPLTPHPVTYPGTARLAS